MALLKKRTNDNTNAVGEKKAKFDKTVRKTKFDKPVEKTKFDKPVEKTNLFSGNFFVVFLCLSSYKLIANPY